jgi:hypothetical protein
MRLECAGQRTAPGHTEARRLPDGNPYALRRIKATCTALARLWCGEWAGCCGLMMGANGVCKVQLRSGVECNVQRACATVQRAGGRAPAGWAPNRLGSGRLGASRLGVSGSGKWWAAHRLGSGGSEGVLQASRGARGPGQVGAEAPARSAPCAGAARRGTRSSRRAAADGAAAFCGQHPPGGTPARGRGGARAAIARGCAPARAHSGGGRGGGDGHRECG